jgi:hypothetical protein
MAILSGLKEVNTKKLDFNRLLPFAVCLFKLHLDDTAILTPNPLHLRDMCALIRRAFFALVASIRELKTVMLTL